MGNTTTPTPWPPTAARRPRVWPGVLLALLYWAALKIPGWLVPQTELHMYLSFLGPMALIALFLVWWLFFSRLPWIDRIFGLIAFGLTGSAAVMGYDPTFRGTKPEDTISGLMFGVLPVVLTGWAVWILVSKNLSRQVRMVGLVAAFVVTWGAFMALRFDGVTGAFSSEYSWRWTPTPEQRLIAERSANKIAAGSVAAATPVPEAGPADWPGFRGPARDGIRTGVRIATDWKDHPPKELWRTKVGPGWSSVAVVGSRLYTQEQLGDDERVVCYDVATGKEVWAHTDKARFTEAVSGAGPRATPTFHAGKVYSLGAKGQLNCLDAATGKKVWSADITTDADAKVPIWGFSASPLVSHGLVTVWAGGPDKSVLAYNAETGKLAWASGKGTGSYSSVHPLKIADTDQLVLVALEGMTGFNPTDGKILWEYDWKAGDEFNRVTQPAVLGDGDLLIGTGFDKGSHRVKVTRTKDGGWTADKVAELRTMSPYFNDLVVHKGHLYGFTSIFLTCVNPDTDKRSWKERGYGSGQVLLLADQDLLLVLAEDGAVALVEATPTARKELARIPAIHGKTWNHPVVAGRKLFVRNGEEMACYELPADDKAVAGR